MSDTPRNPVITERLGSTAELGREPQRSPGTATRVWAVIGAIVLVLTLYVWTRWVTGPYFERVPAGPSEPPMYMKIPLIANAVVLWIGLPVALWFFLVRPWVRERRITLDGMLMISMGLMFFQDPFLNYYSTWCTYNAWLFNRGSWSSEIPGWVSPDEPGRQVPEPLLTNLPGYLYGVLLITIVGCWIMRRIKTRWPGISNVRLILVTYALAFVFDFVMEALVMLPTGLYTYPGAIRSLSFNAGTYYQWPVYEGLMWGGVQAALCCLRFFTDDRGRTVVERGLDAIRGGAVRQQFVRFLAIYGAVSACFFVFYNIPATWLGMHADPWPEDHLKRSYFNGGICGDGTDKPCPHPYLPTPTRHSGYIDTDGRLVLPEGAELPTTVPFERPTR
ncbi:spirocyclase AveC family protein [Mycobacterium sp. MYCO198283]|uniref:spirocyclase AveC family protein n=1 Tax=Mycobacterium sp. MYCO198283 TaxID=2883505 RepID=UPI001E32C1BC|nr:spirocyclase AveC family protein [Mycobacterium sp. MYCO198283]MCG5434184.1 spirocyclase AveC family protein [Mycobacterium sp. MYCO198283]